jgi:hypothetical protein
MRVLRTNVTAVVAVGTSEVKHEVARRQQKWNLKSETWS